MKRFLITGANGEIGHALVEHLLQDKEAQILALDKRASETVDDRVVPIQCDITNLPALQTIFSDYKPDCIFHLAAILSSTGEKNPILAHEVNVEGSVNLIKLALEQIKSNGSPLRFIFPSSIAVYGVPAGTSRESINESQCLTSSTMYGLNKLYVENLGHYFSRVQPGFEFATVRFPGLISAFSLPSGGTSDFASHMIHAAVKGEPYSCYVSAKLELPYMVMPDAVNALLSLQSADREAVCGQSFNVTSFSLGPEKTSAILKETFPNFSLSYQIEQWREDIIQGWPATLDDSHARKSWDWKPQFDLERAFNEYLIPNIMQRYR